MLKISGRYAFTLLFILSAYPGCKDYPAPERDPLQVAYEGTKSRAAELSQKVGREINPLYFRDVVARRFINRQDWENAIARGITDPREVYDPKPITWDQWMKVARTIDDPETRPEVLTKSVLLKWNENALFGTLPPYVKSGVIKSTNNFGSNVSEKYAVTKEGIEALLSQRLFDEKNPLLNWTSLICEEKLPEVNPLPGENEDCQKIWQYASEHRSEEFWGDTFTAMSAGKIAKQWYWFACWPRSQRLPGDMNAGESSCGMIHYPEYQTIEPRLNRVLEHLASEMQTLQFASSTENSTSENKLSPLEVALHAQLNIVALHPFNKGNGRVSRWVMDWVTHQNGFPPILIKDMDQDLSTPFQTYLDQGRQGAWESIQRMNRCLNRIESKGLEGVKNTICDLVAE